MLTYDFRTQIKELKMVIKKIGLIACLIPYVYFSF